MLVLATGCDTATFDPESREELRALTLNQRMIWDDQDITDYLLTYRRTCACPTYERGPFSVEVQNDQRVSASFDGNPIGADSLSQYFTVDGLFDFIEQAFAAQPDRISLQFDPDTGAPILVLIDTDTGTNSDDEIITVTSVDELVGSTASDEQRPIR
jgi:hypothetical protein